MAKTYIDLLNANSLIQKIDFKGKEYGEVSERIKAFRYVYPEGGIETEIIKYENGEIVIKAKVSNEEGKIIGTGIAQEKEGSSFINKTSFIENCETSAVSTLLLSGVSVTINKALLNFSTLDTPELSIP